MTMDETAPARERRYYDDYDRRLAAEIVAMLVYHSDARRVLAIVDIIMNLPLTAPPSEPRLPDAA
jgi:hypothetical protein